MISMHLRVALRVMIVAVLGGGLPVVARADDSAYRGDGVTVYPVTNSDVQLTSEDVVITLEGKDETAPGRYRLPWRVDATLNFRNLGGPTKVQMGFPYRVAGDVNIHPRRPEDLDYVDPHFRTWVDEVETPTVRKEPGASTSPLHEEHEWVYTFPVEFTQGQTRTVRHRYWVGGHSTSDGSGHFTYVLTTGALWAGKIDSALVRLMMPAQAARSCDEICPHEHSARRDGDQIILEWRWHDLEPDFDLEIVTLPASIREATVDKLPNEAWRYGQLEPCEARWYCNRVLAEYGYPFKSPFVRAQFYEEGKLHENPRYSEAELPAAMREFLAKLTAGEPPTE